MGYEAPRTAPYQSVVELETCAQCIFCRIQSATVAFIATGFEYAAEHLLQKVDLVWCEVIEVSSSGNIGLYTPGQILSVIVQIARGLCKTDLYVDYIADRTIQLQVDPTALDKMKQRLKDALPKTVLIHPGTGWESKTFSPEFWDSYIEILKQNGYFVVLIGLNNRAQATLSGDWDSSELSMAP
jgi:hypothetical protein